ncbi:DUF4194 domain-containing protein [Tessaracoccus sp. OH4464_COT-324]|uniref:DUF4194 domain-containing protein n=1 Tax=Tessaracoccus sp. OH4464_COT-324 TaxID=2491059 RepID=UPI0018F35816|nr:DUF4194 domain-containing protein [Tessaracoccus sp. OH4464_COT-324]
MSEVVREEPRVSGAESDEAATLAAAGAEVFVEPVPMENDLEGCFPGDRGVLDSAVRRVLVRLLQRRFLSAERNREDWGVLLANQQVIESRLHDLFVNLVVDLERGVAYKQQVRSDDFDVPILLRDEAYSRTETLILIYLRTVHQRETVAGEASVRVDVEEIEGNALSYFGDGDADIARRQREVRAALARLLKDGILVEESEGRFSISSLVEIVLSAQRLRELNDWLRERAAAGEPIVAAAAEDTDAEAGWADDGEGAED